MYQDPERATHMNNQGRWQLSQKCSSSTLQAPLERTGKHYVKKEERKGLNSMVVMKTEQMRGTEENSYFLLSEICCGTDKKALT